MYIDENGNIAKWLLILSVVAIVVVAAVVCSAVATIVTVENQVPSGEELIQEDEIIFSSDDNINYEAKTGELTINAEWNSDTQTWKIFDSYLITNRKDIYKICEALYSLHKVPTANGSSEYRTIDDMVYEWEEHNKGYLYSKKVPFSTLRQMGIEATKDVDINPGDQNKNVYQLMWERLFS